MTAQGGKIQAATARLFNRELSWLAFNRRVLEEATNEAHPLLERLRFLSISGTNLDEFFMTRVAGSRASSCAGRGSERGWNDRDPAARGDRGTGGSLVVAQQAEWILLREGLSDEGLEGLRRATDASDRVWMSEHFRRADLPVLTPQAIDPSHPFPFIPNGGFSLIFDLRHGKSIEPVVELLMIRQLCRGSSRSRAWPSLYCHRNAYPDPVRTDFPGSARHRGPSG